MMLFDKPDAGREKRRGFHLGREEQRTQWGEWREVPRSSKGLAGAGRLRIYKRIIIFYPRLWRQRYGTMVSKQGKEQVKKGDAQNAAENKGNKIGTRRISEDFPGRDIVFAYLRQESDI